MKTQLTRLARLERRQLKAHGAGIHTLEVRGPEDELKATYVLSQWIRGELADCTRAGYLDQSGRVTRTCPPERRSGAILAGLFAGDNLPDGRWLEVTGGQTDDAGENSEAGAQETNS